MSLMKKMNMAALSAFIFVSGASGALNNMLMSTALANVVINTDKVVSLGEPVSADEFTGFISSYKGVGGFFAAICTVTALLMLGVSIFRLSVSAGNEQARHKAFKGILVSGISLALIGGLTIIIGLFWNIFNP